MLSFLGTNLCAIPVEAMVGVARLCVPRSMQVSEPLICLNIITLREKQSF